MKHRILLILFGLLWGGLLVEKTEDWWSDRDNNLFNNDHWVVGKDTGKYVFYTYPFMMDPIKDGNINLNSYQGFQELLWAEPETSTRRLKKLRFRMFIEGHTYLWVPLRKQGQRQLAVRFSHNIDFPSGFYEYDPTGRLVSHTSFPHGLPKLDSSRWQEAELILEDGQWVARVDSVEVGAVPDPAFTEGYFGFRGCGRPRSKTLLDRVDVEWSEGGKDLIATDDFNGQGTRQHEFLLIILCALAVVLSRLGRSWILDRCIAGVTRSYLVYDLLLAGGTLGLVTCLGALSDLQQLGIAIMSLEWSSLVLFTCQLKRRGLAKQLPVRALWAYAVMVTVLCTAGLLRHGEWLGRTQYPPETEMAEFYPQAFVQTPDPSPGPGRMVLEKPFDLMYGKPFSTGPEAFNRQELSLEFTMPAETTFDIALQQQSFFTKGDLQGEPLPLQRRLIRLSTVERVGSGVASQIARKPAPFYPLAGELKVDHKNTLLVRSSEAGIELELNGVATPILTSCWPLGYGETVLMTHESPIPIHRLEIQALGAVAGGQSIFVLVGLLLFAVVLAGLMLLFRIAGTTSLPLAAAATVAVVQPVCMYAGSMLFIEPLDLTLMPTLRLTLLDCSLAAACTAGLYGVVLHQGKARLPAIQGNVFILLHVLCVGLLVWDVFLPDENPLKLRFAKQHTAPAKAENMQQGLPWYAANWTIGANIYIWKQEFEGRTIPLKKTPGTVRVFVHGGSQAWGSGASSTAETFSGLLHRRLRNSGLKAEVFNAAVNGFGIKGVYRTFQEILLHYEPDVLVIDVGLNDSAGLKKAKNIENHVAAFRRLAEDCANRGIDLIYVQEASAMESNLRLRADLYDAFAVVAQEFGVPLLDARAVFAEAEAEYMLWWDTAHFAPQGHQMMADLIYPALEQVVQQRSQ